MTRKVLFTFVLLLAGCSEPEPPHTTTYAGIAMTVPYRILVGHPLTRQQRREVGKTIEETFAEVDAVYNKWNPDSELSRLNFVEAGKEVLLSPQLYAFLVETGEWVRLTEGRFDPTIEPLQRVWKDKLEKGQLPDDAEIAEASTGVGWDKLRLQGGMCWKADSDTALDLGGVVKGYAIDLIVERLEREGFGNLYVEWGGEIRTAGKHPEGRPWRIFISKLGNANPEEAIAFVDMEDNAVATSGDYLQNWMVEGKMYFHIFDIKKRRPLAASSGSVCSATVMATTCMAADVLATAAMLFEGKDAAEHWLETVKQDHPEMKIRYWIQTRD